MSSTKEWNVHGRRVSPWGKIAWDYSYKMSFHALDVCTLTFHVLIQLDFTSTFAPGLRQALMAQWKSAVDAAFDNKFKLVPVSPGECEVCRSGIVINIYVQFTDSWTWSDDVEIAVDPETERSRSRNWHTGDPDFVSGKGVIHEVGHLLGLDDEYVDPVEYPGKSAGDLPADAANGFMNDVSKPVLERHFRILCFERADVNSHLPCAPYNLVPI